MPIKILVIDDHTLFREGLCHVLAGLEQHVSLLEAAEYDGALKQMAECQDLDLVLLDLNMPGKDGFAVLEHFSTLYPATPVVILSASSDYHDMQRSIDNGAMGFIPKDTSSVDMLNAIRLILAGSVYVPASLKARSVHNQADLTPRQFQVLDLLVQGHSNKGIAAKLELAEATVKMHITAIMRKMGVASRTQAVLAAEKLGLFNQT